MNNKALERKVQRKCIRYWELCTMVNNMPEGKARSRMLANIDRYEIDILELGYSVLGDPLPAPKY